MDRASDSGSEGWGFESLPVYQKTREGLRPLLFFCPRKGLEEAGPAVGWVTKCPGDTLLGRGRVHRRNPHPVGMVDFFYQCVGSTMVWYNPLRRLRRHLRLRCPAADSPAEAGFRLADRAAERSEFSNIMPAGGRHTAKKRAHCALASSATGSAKARGPQRGRLIRSPCGRAVSEAD